MLFSNSIIHTHHNVFVTIMSVDTCNNIKTTDVLPATH